ncbi:MAG TPA: MBL fold metallo-hydrolase [Caldimonas sp.]|jgi:glyoxylase-like metal-dependent hydrolase (beta-lactamase superfamily II)|nr:MBL fold metallo-hydrolase [Caldimonas sp.]
MKPACSLSVRPLLVLAFAALLASCASTGDDATATLARAGQAMGSSSLKTIRYSGSGTGYTFGQAYTPGGAWPKITVHSMARTIDYDSGAMRDEIVLSRAEPLGGGGYPVSGQQRNDQYLNGEIAWNQTGTTVAPGPRFVTDRVHQLWITPHGALRAAQRNRATSRRTSDGGSAVSFSQPGRFSATILIGADGLVTQVDSVFADPVLGDTSAVTVYSDYRDFGGVKLPMRVRQSMGGFPVLDLEIAEVQINPAVALEVPEAARNQAERVVVERLGAGVWFIGGGSHNSVAIEMADHLVLVEAPLTDARTLAVIEQVKTLAPGKPIRFVVNSHGHFDHSGGLRAAVAEGATVVTSAAYVPYFERAFATPNRMRPDRLAQAGKAPRFVAVGDTMTMADAMRAIEIHAIASAPHAESFLMVYLPQERILIEADAFTPAAPNAPPPATPNPYHLNLIENIERLGLPVDRIVPLHGRVVPVGELYAAAGKTSPR